MKRHVYRERDYAFAQLILTLRTAIGLSQAGLAERLGASRRAVAEWEGGLSYPKTDRLQQLIALGVQQQAFAAGREEEEIRALWKAAHQKVWLHEAWLHDLLASPRPVQLSQRAGTPAAHNGAEPAASSRVDLVEALDVSHFTGREVEVAELSEWILEERCRLVTLLGIGGIGKSMLASYLGSRLAPHFEAVLWRSLRDAPECSELVADCITFFSETPPAEFPTSLEQRITHLVARLQTSRCLLVLDNLETLLSSGDPEGSYLPGYEGYGRLIVRLAESAHQSCVLLTSRERPREIEALEGTRSPVRSLRLSGLDDQTAQELLADKGLSGTSLAWQGMVAGYAGNPLALKIVAQAVSDLFGGDLDRFLQEGELLFNGVRPLLRQQVGRLSALEHLLLTWLAVLREWTPLDTLVQVLHPRVLRAQVLEALDALSRRSLLERGQQASFGLQSVVMEYLTNELSEHLAKEIVVCDPQQLRQVALAQAHAKNYVREIQVRLLVQPLLERLRAELGADAQVEAQLLRQLSQFRAEDAATQGYGPANVITLIKALRGHLCGLDLSGLSIRGAYLQGVEMQDANLAGAQLEECVWSQSFDAITAMAISQSGKFWAAAGRRGEVRLWREEGKLLHRVWRAHTDRVWALAFSPDGRTLASGSLDGSVKLWDVESGTSRWARWQTKGITCLAFSPDGGLLASGGQEASVRLWDAKLGHPIQELPHVGPVSALAWSPDGHLLASDDEAGAIWLWEIPSRERAPCAQTLDGHSSWVQGLAFAPDGRTLASASWDGSVKLWDLGEEGCLRARQTLVEQTGEKMHWVTWSPDGATLASSSSGHTIRLWDAKLATSRVALQGHTADVWGLAFTPDNRHLLSGGDDGILRLWEVERGQCVRVLRGYDACLYDLAWSPDGTQLASAGIDSVVTIWQVEGLEGGTPRGRLGGHEWGVYGVEWSLDGSLLASSGLDNTIRLWEPATGSGIQVIRDRDHPDTLCWGLAWSPDGTRLIAGGEDGHVYMWDARGGRLLQRLAGHHGAVISVAWSPDGMQLASGGDNQDSGELCVWDARSGGRMSSLQGLTGAVYAVAWHPVEELLISGGSDGRLCWWDLPSGACVRVREAHQGIVQALKVSPDGHRLASCGDDGAIHIWELERGEHLRTLRRDRPYERLDITDIQGLTQAEIATLRALGAVEDAAEESPGK